MKVQNFEGRSGNAVANQFIIYADDGSRCFQSYDSIIVKIDRKNDRVYLDERYWNYSKTTGKYRNEFLGETSKETKEKIKSGKYILTDLNNK